MGNNNAEVITRWLSAPSICQSVTGWNFIVCLVSQTEFFICVVSQPGRLLINNQPIKLKFVDCPQNLQVMHPES